MTQDDETTARVQEIVTGARKPRKLFGEIATKIKTCFTHKRELHWDGNSINARKSAGNNYEDGSLEETITNPINEEEELLKSPCFYWPDADSVESIKLLGEARDGTFLVRKSSHPDHKYTLTYKRNGRIASARLQYCSETLKYSLNLSNGDFPRERSIRELVYVMTGKDIAMMIDSGPSDRYVHTQLQYPLFRVTSLKEQSRVKLKATFSEAERKEFVEKQLPMELISYLR